MLKDLQLRPGVCVQHHDGLLTVLSVLQGQLDGHQLRLQRGAVVGSPGANLRVACDGSSACPAAVWVYGVVAVVHGPPWLGDPRHGHEGVLPKLRGDTERLAGGQRSATRPPRHAAASWTRGRPRSAPLG
ncbi:hypothetical protein E2C01_039936 [Portunus trituberculatus]|uniref:Uncharacterized protein n=1 Tax=Portunus trituberculatus TaxID=210409 RepID=A0A5B7FPD3_PORTR|nr:hypothetical protein [Portunus trituberculatus]